MGAGRREESFGRRGFKTLDGGARRGNFTDEDSAFFLTES